MCFHYQSEIFKVLYEGSLRTRAVHIASGSTIVTDAPTDNNGKGEAFSPTDLVATSLASCMLTIMGIIAERDGIDLKGAHAEVEKVMSKNPRRISKVGIRIHLNGHLINPPDRDRLERAARRCPVGGSLHPEIEEEVIFVYDE